MSSEYTKLGGFTKIGDVTESVISDIKTIQNQIVAMYTSSGKKAPSITMFVPISMQSQIVAGTKYIVKIQTNSNYFIHVKYVKKYNGEIELQSVETNKTLLDGLI